jgi:hypothetical protein
VRLLPCLSPFPARSGRPSRLPGGLADQNTEHPSADETPPRDPAAVSTYTASISLANLSHRAIISGTLISLSDCNAVSSDFTFPEDARWNAERQAVEFGVRDRRVPRRGPVRRRVFQPIAERKLRRRQLTEDGNVEISGRDLQAALKPALRLWPRNGVPGRQRPFPLPTDAQTSP